MTGRDNRLAANGLDLQGGLYRSLELDRAVSDQDGSYQRVPHGWRRRPVPISRWSIGPASGDGLFW
jgi:hypothetical protein